MARCFIADVHLGKLAKNLRLLGFDTVYRNNFTNSELVEIAIREDRVLLSRNNLLQKKNPGLPFLSIKSETLEQQLEQVIQESTLIQQINPFSRCLVCNEALVMVTKDSVWNDLQPNTVKFFHEFWRCASCNRLYWKGSHYDRMLQLVKRLAEK